MLDPKKAAEVAQSKLTAAVEELVIAEAMCQYLDSAECIPGSAQIVASVKGAQTAVENAIIRLDPLTEPVK